MGGWGPQEFQSGPPGPTPGFPALSQGPSGPTPGFSGPLGFPNPVPRTWAQLPGSCKPTSRSPDPSPKSPSQFHPQSRPAPPWGSWAPTRSSNPILHVLSPVLNISQDFSQLHLCSASQPLILSPGPPSSTLEAGSLAPRVSPQGTPSFHTLPEAHNSFLISKCPNPDSPHRPPNAISFSLGPPRLCEKRLVRAQQEATPCGKGDAGDRGSDPGGLLT